jgi:hypothetical protein
MAEILVSRVNHNSQCRIYLLLYLLVSILLQRAEKLNSLARCHNL